MIIADAVIESAELPKQGLSSQDYPFFLGFKYSLPFFMNVASNLNNINIVIGVIGDDDYLFVFDFVITKIILVTLIMVKMK